MKHTNAKLRYLSNVRKTVLFIVFMLCLCFSLCACVPPDDTPPAVEKLPTPVFDVNRYNNFVNWRRVKEADEYEIVVTVDGKDVMQEKAEDENCYLPFMSSYRDATVKVRAVCTADAARNSDWAELLTQFPEEYSSEEAQKFRFRDAIMSAVWKYKEDIFTTYYFDQVNDIADVYCDFEANTVCAVVYARLENNGYNVFQCTFTYETLDKEEDIIGVMPVSCTVYTYDWNKKYNVAPSLLRSEALTGKLALLAADTDSHLEVLRDKPSSLDRENKCYYAVLALKYEQDGETHYALTKQTFKLAYTKTIAEDNYTYMIEKSETCTIEETYFYECGQLTAQFFLDDIYYC